jgi:hypothetical protein
LVLVGDGLLLSVGDGLLLSVGDGLLLSVGDGLLLSVDNGDRLTVHDSVRELVAVSSKSAVCRKPAVSRGPAASSESAICRKPALASQPASCMAFSSFSRLKMRVRSIVVHTKETMPAFAATRGTKGSMMQSRSRITASRPDP